MKKLILVTSPPACGKTFISRQLAKQLKNVVYLDKDTLIVLSKQIFEVANQEYNRSSDFFKAEIRDYEYYAVLDLAFEALDYADLALINAPFAQEIRDAEYIADLKKKLAAKGAELKIIWVETSPEVSRQRMIARNSDRDSWKLENWDQYVAEQNFNAPYELNADGSETMIIFKNSSDDEYKNSLITVSEKLING